MILATGWVISGCVEAVPFETVDQGVDSGDQEPAQLVLRSQEAWRQVWERHEALLIHAPEQPPVDFHKEMVLAVFLGQRPTGGFAIEIKAVDTRADALHVLVEETSPPPEAMVTQAFTSPYHIVRLKRVALPVQFEFRRTVAAQHF